jgi:hypothetical protein
MTAANIARALGAAHRSGRWWRCICPVHGSRTGRSATLALQDGHCGLAVHCHAGCDPRDILAELRRRGLLDGLKDRPRPTPTARDDGARRIEIAHRIWGMGRDAHATPVARYLAGRGITPRVPAILRYSASLWRRDGAGPAMVARIDGPNSEFYGFHRTWLDRGPDGVWRRTERRMLGRAAGGAVRLAPAAETLLVGEGIETTLAAMIASGLPGWAALSAGGIEALILPPSVSEVVVVADHDASGTGERAARKAALRWRAEGRRVCVYMPPQVGEDAADRLFSTIYGLAPVEAGKRPSEYRP